MRVKELTVQNFRPFYGRQVINLETEERKPLILIKALNDVGKTSFFKAIQFCLYGSKATSEKTFQHVNRTACAEGDGTMLVKLSFDHEGKFYEIIRSVEFKKADSGSPIEIVEKDVDIIENGISVPLKTSREQNEFIEAILPEDASQFFLFDGEEIKKYTQHPPGPHVRDAIEMVLGIKELRNARDDLDIIYRDIKHDLDAFLVKQDTNNKEALEVEALGQEVENLRIEIDKLENRIKEAEANIKSFDETLKRNKAIQDKIEQRKQAEENRKGILEQISTIKEQLRNFNQHLGAILIAPLLQELSKETRATTANWKRNALAILIQSNLCICDRPIDELIRQKFERQLERDEGISVRKYLGDQATDLLLLAEPTAQEKELSDMLVNHNTMQSNLTLTQQTIDDLTKEIGQRADIPTDIKGTNDLRNRAAEDLSNYQKEIASKKALLELKSAEHKRRQEKLTAQSTDKDVKNQSNCKESAEECEAGIIEVIDNIVEKSKIGVATLASEVFLRLTNAPQLYQGIEITDEYELKIKTIGGVIRPVWDQMPSAGQSQIIAASFIAALNRYSAKEAPIVIDTPIGRLDPIHKSNLIKYYPDLGSQIVILYQPNELTPEDIAPIFKYISSEWKFDRNPKNPDATLVTKM